MEKAEQYRRQQLNETVTVLFEIPDTAGQLKGYSEHYVPVTAEGNRDLINQLVPVTLSRMAEDRVFGCVA